jgi:hypothetical protein
MADSSSCRSFNNHEVCGHLDKFIKSRQPLSDARAGAGLHLSGIERKIAMHHPWTSRAHRQPCITSVPIAIPFDSCRVFVLPSCRSPLGDLPGMLAGSPAFPVVRRFADGAALSGDRRLVPMNRRHANQTAPHPRRLDGDRLNGGVAQPRRRRPSQERASLHAWVSGGWATYLFATQSPNSFRSACLRDGNESEGGQGC